MTTKKDLVWAAVQEIDATHTRQLKALKKRRKDLIWAVALVLVAVTLVVGAAAGLLL